MPSIINNPTLTIMSSVALTRREKLQLIKALKRNGKVGMYAKAKELKLNLLQLGLNL